MNNKKTVYTYNGKDITFYYDDEYFKVTTDNLSLVKFIRVLVKDKTLVEFGCGLGIIPLLMGDYNLKIVGIECDKKACSLALSSIKENNLEEKITIINDYVQNVRDYFEINSVDIVVCNPPYFTLENESQVSSKNAKKIARHDLSLTMEDVVSNANKILKNGGGLFLIQRVERFFEIRDLLKQYGLAIKRVQFIYHDMEKPSKLFLLEARKNGKEQGLKVMAPLMVGKEDCDG